jgi:pyruvate formate lyase activating enzyme
VDEGLADYVAMDLKNSRERYGETAGCAVDTDKIDESVRFLLSGAADYEFRTTVVRGLHRAEDFPAMGRWIRGAKRWFLQGFVDSGDLIGTGLSAFPPEEMRAFLLLAQKEIPSAELRGI